jgi:hypothetical protein
MGRGARLDPSTDVRNVRRALELGNYEARGSHDG